MVPFLFGLIVAYLITGACSATFPTAVSNRAYTPGTRFIAWPGVVFPDSPFGMVLSWAMRPSKP